MSSRLKLINGMKDALALVRNGVPIEDAATIHGVDDEELEAAVAELSRSRSHFVAEMVGVVVAAAQGGDAKAAAWLLERVSPAFRPPARQGAEEVRAGDERIVEMPTNGRLRGEN